MDRQLKVVGISGSLRRGSYNTAVLRSLPELAPPEMAIEPLPPLAGFPLYNADLRETEGFPTVANDLAEKLDAADGVIFVTPEYNYSVPGVLKNAIDWVSRLPDQPFRNKPVLLQSAATGLFGGMRAQYHMRQIMVYLDAIVFTRPEVMVTQARLKIDEASGRLTDEPTRDVIRIQLAAFAQFIRRVSGGGNVPAMG